MFSAIKGPSDIPVLECFACEVFVRMNQMGARRQLHSSSTDKAEEISANKVFQIDCKSL